MMIFETMPSSSVSTVPGDADADAVSVALGGRILLTATLSGPHLGGSYHSKQ